ncbi:peptidase [Sphingomonas piscis]|uniref:Peptidase n=1 Tax=Sphingomonas piscis TaxID=2714943 RepID=A0A6G7YRW8_9SPHN|nr:peptidase [Sphingomonas piscis]QIK79486.1 peptidase [Sphingomonas piscis]
MTYCLGMLLDAGLIMIADTRTNAGVDNISSYRKLHILADEPEQQLYLATSGNLSVTQTVVSMLREGIPATDDSALIRTLSQATSMFRAAQMVGEALQMANRTIGEALQALKISSSATLLLGGRIGDAPPALFQIYEAGNFIECTADVPFMQIGETKYGRPILDRAIRTGTPIEEAVKIAFLSFDSSMRSNVAIGRPLDMLVLPSAPASRPLIRRIEHDDAYFNEVSRRWSTLLYEATKSILNPELSFTAPPR